MTIKKEYWRNGWALVVLMVAQGAIVGHAAERDKPERSITVQGTGRLNTEPDMAYVQIEVSEEGQELQPLSDSVRQKMEAVLKAVRGIGIADKDIQTRNYRVTPKRRYDGKGNSRVEGYSVSNHIQVTIRDIKKIGRVLTASQHAGANQVLGPQFQLEDPQKAQRQTLGLAMEDAKAKASLLAEKAGASLGHVLVIQESGISIPPPRPMMAMRSAGMSGLEVAEPISAGEETITATVTVTYALQ